MGNEVRVCLVCNEDGRQFDKIKSNYVCVNCLEKLKVIKQLEMIDKAITDLKSSKSTYAIMSASRKGLFNKAEESVKQKIKNGVTFDSKCEAIIALELERENTEYIVHWKIGKNIVDFMLPKEKLIIEVDGSLYHTDESRDFIKDRSVMREVGESWEIIRIKEDIIPRYVSNNLTEALRHVIIQRKDDKRFRDSRGDSYYIRQYIELQYYLRSCAK